MNSFGGSVISGIISGLIATFLAVVVRAFWIRVMVPWYEERVYHDAKIEGKWRSRVEYSSSSEDWDEFIVEVQRKSHRIEAILMCVNGANKGSTYRFDGTFGNLILTGSYASLDRTRLARGTFTLILVRDGQAMEGCGSIYSPIKGCIFNTLIHAQREI